MVGIFKANNPVNTFLLFFYGLILKISFFSHYPLPVSGKTDGILYNELLLVLQTISNDLPVIYSIITYLLLFIQAVTFNKIFNHQHLTQRPTYLPAMTYLLITSLFSEWNMLSSTLIANTLFIWVWYKLNTLYNSKQAKADLFYIGMAIGVAALFYFPLLAFAIMIAFALTITRPFNITEWVIALIGILAPFYYLAVWLYLSDNIKYYKLPVLSFSLPNILNWWLSAGLILIITGFFAGAYFVQANVRKQVVQIRNRWSLMWLLLLLSVLIPFVSDTHSFKYWILSAVPLSAFIACAFFYPSKRWFTLLLHWLMVCLVIIVSYYNK